MECQRQGEARLPWLRRHREIGLREIVDAQERRLSAFAESPQLDNSYVCFFVVHVDGTSVPKACSSKSTPPDAFPEDPNGSAPCFGRVMPEFALSG